MWKRGSKDGGSGGEEVESLEEEENRERERTRLYGVWEGELTSPLTFILAFFFPYLAL